MDFKNHLTYCMWPTVCDLLIVTYCLCSAVGCDLLPWADWFFFSPRIGNLGTIFLPFLSLSGSSSSGCFITLEFLLPNGTGAGSSSLLTDWTGDNLIQLYYTISHLDDTAINMFTWLGIWFSQQSLFRFDSVYKLSCTSEYKVAWSLKDNINLNVILVLTEVIYGWMG